MMVNTDLRRSYFAVVAAWIVMIVSAAAVLMNAEDAFAARDIEWGRFQNSPDNNGVTSVETPASYEEAALKWGKPIVEGYTTSFTPPLIIDDHIYTASSKHVYKMDKDGNVVKESDEMEINVSYAMHPMTYAEEEDALYIPLLDGRVECVDADTLSHKWISKVYSGFQALSPITYKDGYVYTGTWQTKTSDGAYFCLDAKTGKTVWEFWPSEQKTETTARALDVFPTPVGQNSPDNFYTYTAVIKVSPKSGYKFATDNNGRCWLYDDKGNKYVPNGVSEASMIPSTVNGLAGNITNNDDGTATIRVKFDYRSSGFDQEGGSQTGQVSLTGLDTPVVGSDLDKSVSTSNPITVDKIEWKTGDIPHGFYWAGCYANDDYIVFGSDDGQNNTFGASGDSTYTKTSTLYSLNRKNGKVVDKIDGLKGDIRSTVVHKNGYIYFTSKGGNLHKVKLGDDGKFSDLSMFETGAMMTASPVVYGGRIYVGIAGMGGQFNADGGHMFAVFRDDAELTGVAEYETRIGSSVELKIMTGGTGSFIYMTPIAGYPQASPVLSTATEASDGIVRLYFTYNAFPGGIYYLEDTASSTKVNHAEAKTLFKPESDMQQYCISPIAVDKSGTLYIKNDSGYMMAVAVNKAYLNNIKVTYGDDEAVWNESFKSGTLNYDLRLPNDAKTANFELDVPEGMTASINGSAYTGGKMGVPVSEESSDTSVVVSKTVGGKTYRRTYTLSMSTQKNNANLEGIALNDTNSVPKVVVDTEGSTASNLAYGYDPTFDPGITKYVSRAYKQAKTYVNVWFKTSDPESTVKVYPVDSVGNKVANMNPDGTMKQVKSGSYVHCPVYWIKNRISAEVRIEVTSASGLVTKDYNVELVRSEDHLDVGEEPLEVSPATVTLYTGNGQLTQQVTAKLGSNDVTSKCTWFSSRPEVVNVDGNGVISAQSREGEAVVWARYLGQDTEDRPISVYVVMPTAAAPVANIDSGTYDSVRKITLTSSTPNAEIYYTLGDMSEDVPRPTKENATKYTGPIDLGEQGKIGKYKLRARTYCTGYSSHEKNSVSDYEYTIDLRETIDNNVDIKDVITPVVGQALSDNASCDDSRIIIKSVKWYKVDGTTEEEASGAAETNATYIVRLGLGTDDEKYKFGDNISVKINGRSAPADFSTDSDGTARLASYYMYYADFTNIDRVRIVDVEAPKVGKVFDTDICVAGGNYSDHVRIDEVYWTDKDGNRVDENGTAGPGEYNSEYEIHIKLSPKEGAGFSDDAAVLLSKDGEQIEPDVEKDPDGSLLITASYVTPKLKVDTSSDNGLSVSPSSITNLDNGISISEIRAKLKSGIKVNVTTEDGEKHELSSDDVIWDEDVIKSVYDPGSVKPSAFYTVGRVTLPDYMDANGSSRIVTVFVGVNQGVVAAPTFTPASGIYTTAQTVTMASTTPGAGIFYTRSDQSGTLVYQSPITLSGASGKSVTYTFKAYASKNGINSSTVTYSIEIDRTAEASGNNSNAGNTGGNTSGSTTPSSTNAAANSIDAITPNDVAAAAAKENKSIGAVAASGISTVGNIGKKQMTVKYKKINGAVNYRIAYRKAGAKTWTYKWTAGKPTYTIKGFAKGSMLEFKLATYKIVNGEWQRSAWSNEVYRYMMTSKPKVKAGKKKAKVTLARAKGSSGYTVLYSLKKNMKGKKTVTLKGWKKTKTTLKRLKSKKTYYVKARPYKKYKGKTYIGILSGAKKVKVK